MIRQQRCSRRPYPSRHYLCIVLCHIGIQNWNDARGKFRAARFYTYGGFADDNEFLLIVINAF